MFRWIRQRRRSRNEHSVFGDEGPAKSVAHPAPPHIPLPLQESMGTQPANHHKPPTELVEPAPLKQRVGGGVGGVAVASEARLAPDSTEAYSSRFSWFDTPPRRPRNPEEPRMTREDIGATIAATLRRTPRGTVIDGNVIEGAAPNISEPPTFAELERQWVKLDASLRYTVTDVLTGPDSALGFYGEAQIAHLSQTHNERAHEPSLV